MENIPIVLDTLKILGALLFFALAIVFRIGGCFSPYFSIFLALQGTVVLAYGGDVAQIAQYREEFPAAFAFGILPFLGLMPFLFLSALAARGRRLPGFARRLAITGVAAALIALALFIFVPGRFNILPGPGSSEVLSWIWNFWYMGWIVGAVLILQKVDIDSETRILRWLGYFMALVLVLSAIFESISIYLDFFLTPLLMILMVYSVLGVLIFHAPRLIRESRRRYAGSDLTSEEAHRLAEKAERKLVETKLWRNGHLTLSELAEICASSPRDLSQAVNQRFGVGFPAWVNAHRLQEAEKNLAESRGKIADIAFASGFNSLSSFNAAFKARNGITPGEWRRKHMTVS